MNLRDDQSEATVTDFDKITTRGPVRCLEPWGQCYKPEDMMMVTNHLTKTKDKLS